MAKSGGTTPLEMLPRVLESYRRCHIDKGISVYGVIEKASGNLIGAAGFNVHETLEKVELLYHFARDCWGKGYATEAAQACIVLARQHPEVKTVYASTAPDNLSSIKVLEKAGLRFVDTRWLDDTQQEEPYYELELK